MKKGLHQIFSVHSSLKQQGEKAGGREGKMPRMLRHAGSAALFLAGLCLMLAGLSKLVVPREISKECGIQDAGANAIQNEPEGTIDVLILGDSETYSSMIPLQMWRDYGITGYCCGTSGQNLGYSLLFLKKAFARQSPKVVLLETNAFFCDFSYGEALLYQLDRKLPVFNYHNRWKNWVGGTKQKVTSVYAGNQTKGYVYSKAIAPADASDYMHPSEEAEPVSAKSLAYFKSIVDFCREKETALVLVSTPSTKNWNYKRHNRLSKLAAEHGVAYVDMNLLPELKIDWARDSRDHGDHLNHSGAVKVTGYLGGFLAKNYGLSDHRGEKAFEQWDEDLKEFEKIADLRTSSN